MKSEAEKIFLGYTTAQLALTLTCTANMIQNGETFDTVKCKVGGAAVPAYLQEGLLNMLKENTYSKQAPDQMQLLFENRCEPIWSGQARLSLLSPPYLSSPLRH